MRTIIAITAIGMLALATPAKAQERVGSAALGALSGAIVLGPIGLVAGAVIGFTAGPEIGRSLRGKQSAPRAQRTSRSTKTAARVATRRTNSSPAAGVVTPAPGVGGPPPQGLE